MNVPLKILMNASMPGGKRTPVPTKRWQPLNNGREKFIHPHYGPCERNVDPNVSRLVIEQIGRREFAQAVRMSSYKKQSLDLPKGNLDQNAYRFWIGAEETHSRFRKCRACHMTILSDADMALHTEAFKCTLVLTEAFKLLLRDGRCVVCDDRTVNQRYGMPLCTEHCIKSWMFESKDMQAGLLQAVTLAAKNNPNYLMAVQKARDNAKVIHP